MARLKKIKQEEPKLEEEKLDGVFRIFTITNHVKARVVVRIELPNNEVHQKIYGNMPRLEVVIPYIGETFEFYVDNELIGNAILLDASKNNIEFDYMEEQ